MHYRLCQVAFYGMQFGGGAHDGDSQTKIMEKWEHDFVQYLTLPSQHPAGDILANSAGPRT